MANKAGENAVGYSHDRVDRAATPLCGAHRGAKGNPLLIKPQLGAVKGTAYDLPSDFQFTYGLKMPRDGLTAGLVVDNWAEHAGTKDMLPARDFKALNKAAIKAGNLDAKSVRDYTNSHDIRVKLGGDTQASPLPIDDNTVFGKTVRRRNPNHGRARPPSSSLPRAPRHALTSHPDLGPMQVRPSTPFGDLVSHGFRYDWVMNSALADEYVRAARDAPWVAGRTCACVHAHGMRGDLTLAGVVAGEGDEA